MVSKQVDKYSTSLNHSVAIGSVIYLPHHSSYDEARANCHRRTCLEFGHLLKFSSPSFGGMTTQDDWRTCQCLAFQAESPLNSARLVTAHVPLHHSAEGSPELAPLLSESPLSFNSPTTSSPLPSQTAAPIGDRPARPPSRFFLGRPLSSLRYPLFSTRLFLRLQSCDSRQSTSSTAWATDQTTSIPDLVHPPSGPTPLFAIPSPAETLVSSFSLALTNQAR